MTEQLEGQMSIFDVYGPDIWSGKTCQEHSVQAKEQTSTQSCRKPQKLQTRMPLYLNLRGGRSGVIQEPSWETGGALLGVYTMRSFGESPSEERESRLSQILEESPHPKYSLSEKACKGILNRAERRGKILPEQLDQALRAQAGLLVSKNEPENQGGKGILIQDEHTGALSTLNNQSVCISIGNGQLHDAMSPSVEVSKTLNCMDDPAKIMVLNDQGGSQMDVSEGEVVATFQNTGQGWWNESEVGATLRTPCGGDSVKANLVAQEMAVRRLTPLECERLQGYPDGWTDIGDWADSKGKKHKPADTPRYKALGNSIALPFWEWLAKRIAEHYQTTPHTMASLFDGIGGFPIAFSRAGFDPVWASEIEEFPMAVTKIRFPEEEP